jgi:plasmid stabilization system protein ParE
MQVILSKRAKNKIEKLLVYLEQEWSIKAKYDFVKKLDRSVSQISKLPYSCPESRKSPGIFKCVITSQTSLFYRINNEKIEIITIFDNRQSPVRLKKEI